MAVIHKPRVLLVDDDTDLVELLADYLAQDGFDVESTGDAESATSLVLAGNFDIVVLDVMLPGMSGIDALKNIRAITNLPVLMLTARGDDADRIVGLELGADDYVPKPCTPRELAARIRAILKRVAVTVQEQSTLMLGDVVIDTRRRTVSLEGARLKLTGSEYGILEVLAYRAGKPVSKEELSLSALGRPLSLYERSVDVHISNLRNKLGAHRDGRSRIQSIRRLGYVLVLD